MVYYRNLQKKMQLLKQNLNNCVILKNIYSQTLLTYHVVIINKMHIFNNPLDFDDFGAYQNIYFSEIW